jgi:hypothetical protein
MEKWPPDRRVPRLAYASERILGPFVSPLVEKYYGSWDLPAIALDILSLIWALLFFS